MRKEILNELKEAYLPYSEGWKEWTKIKGCILTDLERYAMEIHLRNDFEIVPEEGIMFYNKKEFTDKIKEKLFDHLQLLLYGAFLVETPCYRYVEDG